MAGISFFIMILLGLAVAIVIISIVIYNRRLDKIARGEIHDTHSALPEPGTTAGVIYKSVLMIVTIVVVFSIGTVTSTLISMQSSMRQMELSQDRLSREISDLSRQLTEQGSLVRTYDWEFMNPDFSTMTAQLRYSVTLKQYSDDMVVSLNLNGKETKLSREGAGVYGGTFSVGFFERYGDTVLCVTENGKTITEETDFPDYAYWNFLPLTSVCANFTSDYHGGKLTYGGSYWIEMNSLEEVKSVKLSYLTDGQVIKSMDVTKEIAEHETIELEKGLKLKKDLTFRIEIEMKNGFKVEQQNLMIYATDFDQENAEHFQVYDADGKLVWEEKW